MKSSNKEEFSYDSAKEQFAKYFAGKGINGWEPSQDSEVKVKKMIGEESFSRQGHGACRVLGYIHRNESSEKQLLAIAEERIKGVSRRHSTQENRYLS